MTAIYFTGSLLSLFSHRYLKGWKKGCGNGFGRLQLYLACLSTFFYFSFRFYKQNWFFFPIYKYIHYVSKQLQRFFKVYINFSCYFLLFKINAFYFLFFYYLIIFLLNSDKPLLSNIFSVQWIYLPLLFSFFKVYLEDFLIGP